MSSSISASSGRARLRAALTKGARRSLATMAFAAIIGPLLYAGLVTFQLGAWSRAQWWLYDILTLRRHFYADIVQPLGPDARKTLVAAGSGTLFGLDGGAVTRATGETVLNFGMHAGLDIDLLLAQLDGFVDANDRVVMPLEFEHYSRTAVTDLSAETFLAFLYPYADAIPFTRLARLAAAAHPLNVLDGVGNRIGEILGTRPSPARPLATLLGDWKAARGSGAPDDDHAPYDYSTMNAHGDKELMLQTPKDAEADMRAATTPAQPIVTPYAAGALADARKVVEAKGASLILTWPVIVEDDSGTIFTPEYWQRIIDLARAADAAGSPIHCDPIGAIVPVQYRYDTPYHVNWKGALVYSAGFAACLPQIESRPFDWKGADAAALAARAKARIAELKRPPDPLIFGYERNIRLLQTLNDAVLAAHAATGSYPDELPAVDPDLPVVEKGAGLFLPWYRTDGTDYKLVAEDPHDCFAVSEGWAAMIDPTRPVDGGCTYGFWTPGAADW